MALQVGTNSAACTDYTKNGRMGKTKEQKTQTKKTGFRQQRNVAEGSKGEGRRLHILSNDTYYIKMSLCWYLLALLTAGEVSDCPCRISKFPRMQC